MRILVLLMLVLALAACAAPAPATIAPPTATNAPVPATPSSTSQPVALTLTPRPATPTTTSTPSATPNAPDIRGVFGSPSTFATHDELAGYGFSFGPSDGQFGAIPAGGNNYIFYGDAGSTSSCAGTKNAKGTFSFAGTLDHVTGSNGCKRLFGPGDGPTGWVFDKNYAGGGAICFIGLSPSATRTTSQGARSTTRLSSAKPATRQSEARRHGSISVVFLSVNSRTTRLRFSRACR